MHITRVSPPVNPMDRRRRAVIVTVALLSSHQVFSIQRLRCTQNTRANTRAPSTHPSIYMHHKHSIAECVARVGYDCIDAARARAHGFHYYTINQSLTDSITQTRTWIASHHICKQVHGRPRNGRQRVVVGSASGCQGGGCGCQGGGSRWVLNGSIDRLIVSLRTYHCTATRPP